MPTHRDMPPGWDSEADRRRAEADAADQRAREMRRQFRVLSAPTPDALQAEDEARTETSVPPPTAA